MQNLKQKKPQIGLLRSIKVKLSNLVFFDQWILMFDLQDDISRSFWKFKKIIPPKDRLWADPLVIYKDNKYYIFIEELLYSNKKGYIALMMMDEQGRYTKPEKILERPYHLSYPFVFEYKGDYYMIHGDPTNKTVEVYKCIEFPRKWEFHKKLIEGIKAVDATLFYHHDKWWLFVGVPNYEGETRWDELFLFYADNPLSDRWMSHPQNPIVSDVRKARPAGRIFEYDKNIFRPAQNGSKSYGYGLSFNRIDVLNEKEYQEREIESIQPTWDRKINGIHTFDHVNRLTLIDAKLRRVRYI